jgi:hypothetical protein
MAGRARRGGWTCVVGLGTAAALLAAGCAAAEPTARDATPAASTAPAQASGLPSAAQLQAALLAPADMGSAFTRQPTESPSGSGSSSSTTVAGCPQLQFLVSVGAALSPADQGVTYQAGEVGPTIAESLITAPSADLAHAYADDVAAMRSCKHLEVDADGTALPLTLSPITFGSPQSAAVRMDGTLQGVQINAYLALDRIGPTELAYFFLQVGSGSSQVAAYYFRVADAKAEQQLNTFA